MPWEASTTATTEPSGASAPTGPGGSGSCRPEGDVPDFERAFGGHPSSMAVDADCDRPVESGGDQWPHASQRGRVEDHGRAVGGEDGQATEAVAEGGDRCRGQHRCVHRRQRDWIDEDDLALSRSAGQRASQGERRPVRRKCGRCDSGAVQGSQCVREGKPATRRCVEYRCHAGPVKGDRARARAPCRDTQQALSRPDQDVPRLRLPEPGWRSGRNGSAALGPSTPPERRAAARRPACRS